MKEYIIGNCTIVVSRPSLSEAERSKRESAIQIALQQYGKEIHNKENRYES